MKARILSLLDLQKFPFHRVQAHVICNFPYAKLSKMGGRQRAQPRTEAFYTTTHEHM